MYQNVPFLNHFFALLDFGSRDEERRTKGEGRGEAEDGRRTRDEGRTTRLGGGRAVAGRATNLDAD